jgi:hypothetical protein
MPARLRARGLPACGYVIGAEFIWLRGDDSEAAHPFAGRRLPVLPQACKRHDAAIGERDCIRLLARARLLPFVKVVDRHQATTALERLTKRRPGLDAFGLGVDVGEADLDVLGGIVTVTGEGKELARLNTDFMRPQPQLATGRLLRP